MNNFNQKLNDFYDAFGTGKAMVLSTASNNKVSSRMMSVILIDGIFYFQTDRRFRKFNQIIDNPNVSLCIDNIQIEGKCTQIGTPSDKRDFIEQYKNTFPGAYKMYSISNNEVLFSIEPLYIQKWIYENDIPFIEIFDIKLKKYDRIPYITDGEADDN
ncbi:MAG: pyridoxamine 5'-phosphate oxidase family protein [Eubacterium sp.]